MSVTSFVIIPKNESEGKPAQNRHKLPVEVSRLAALAHRAGVHLLPGRSRNDRESGSEIASHQGKAKPPPCRS